MIELRVGSRLDRGIKRKDRPNEDSLFTTQGILCSDGLWEMVRDTQIAGILTHALSDPPTMANMLVQAALVGGGADNVSVIVVQVRKAPGEAEK